MRETERGGTDGEMERGTREGEGENHIQHSR